MWPCRDVSLEEQRLVLMKRRGSTVGRRSILKSFNLAAAPCRALNCMQIEGVTDIRCESCAACMANCSALKCPAYFPS